MYNDTDSLIDASIKISDRDDILTRQDKWMTHITRFAIDTQESLFYINPDSTATITMTVVEFHDIENYQRIVKISGIGGGKVIVDIGI